MCYLRSIGGDELIIFIDFADSYDNVNIAKLKGIITDYKIFWERKINFLLKISCNFLI